ncbi:MAG: isoamylase early set domain-containing protein [Ardenticatenaceae bacterium]|nr:isoamylase early set domain-containing protein [Anaerolineales bacterium]MCB8938720.1 isoamylase early set domain-containing protein [Ardenticatenaceae bacterium]MCB8973956.1 isoamylase early set domain-containing protein [Ardenticatenaceae bacterium]
MFTKKFFKTKDECEVTFELNVENAEQVVLVSEHNGWEPIDMKQAKNGPFRTKVRLPKDGQFQFRYLVDGSEWHNDEAADAYWANEHGGDNSVISTAN